MSLSGNQKALMYALGAVARGGATRGGYHSMLPYISIGGSVFPGGSGRVLLADLSIRDLLDETPNTCQLTVTGTAPPAGTEIIITLGSKNSGTRLFAGNVISEEQGYYAQKPANVYHRLNGIDYTWRLGQHLVNRQYANQTVAAIATDLVTAFAEGITAQHIAADAGAILIDAISFTNTALADALTQLCSRAGAYWNIDYFKDLHLFETEPTTVTPDPTPLTPTHPSLANLTVNEDLSQIVTRVFVEGGGVTALAPIPPGATMIPVETAAWYQPAGGTVMSGPQRITYGAAAPGGGGALVGPGTSPSMAPTLAPTSGSGIEPGVHTYAYTDTTPSGESLPSPLASIPLGPVTPPTTALYVNPALRGCMNPGVAGLDVGSHDYAMTFVNGGGETTPSPAWFGGAAVAYLIADPTAYPLLSNSPSGGGVEVRISPNTYYEWKYSYATQSGSETNPSPATGFTTGPAVTSSPNPIYPQLLVPYSTDPFVYAIRVYRSPPGGGPPWRYAGTYVQNNPAGGNTYIVEYASNAAIAAGTLPPPSSQALVNFARVDGLTVSPDVSVTGRKLYRRFNGSGPYKFCQTMNAGSTFTSDSLPNASLGANAPSANTAISAAVAVSAIAAGVAPTTGRKLYRTKANASQLQLLATLANNTTTTYTDTTPDASLGANVPVGDSSGITQPSGQVVAGSTTLLLAGAGGANPAGGWCATGSQVIRYGGVSGNVLTGIPPSGPGAITATISYNSTVTFLPALTGIPASGAGAIVYPIQSGDDVNLLVTCNDVNAQTALAALIGGSGILETYIQDRRIGFAEATARGVAMLEERSTLLVEVHYTCRDPLTRSGATIVCNLPSPTNLAGNYKIQDVTISAFSAKPGQPPTYTVQASSQRYSLDDLLRMARGTIGA